MGTVVRAYSATVLKGAVPSMWNATFQSLVWR